VFVTFSTLEVDRALVGALAAVVVASWVVAAIAFAYAATVARNRSERGALVLGASFGNTGFLGLPLAQLVFGNAGLALAVAYARVAWLVPDTAISTTLAHLHGDPTVRRRSRIVFVNPPLLALVAAVALRAAHAVPDVGTARNVATALVAPFGFLLLGVALPLDRARPGVDDLPRAVGALAIRMVGGPATLFLVAHLAGAGVPGVFYFLAGMPSAFHLLVLARVYGLRPRLMRVLVVGSTAVAVVGVGIAVAVERTLAG
jgi:predicted permease